MEPETRLLEGYRGLDLTTEAGFLCGKILADLGADVIKIEPPSGDPARNSGPFYHDIPEPEKSLPWFAFNANKRGLTLNIEARDGQDLFKKLAKKADFVVESFAAGYMDSLGLGYSALSQVNRGLVLTSVTPFGQTGPYRDYKGSDLVSLAMGGYMHLCGDPDRAPMRISTPQASLHAGGQAAVGTMMALYHKATTGEGQHVDVSTQASVVACTLSAIPWWQLNQVNLQRAGRFRTGWGSVRVRNVWPCQDGFVSFFLLGGQPGAITNREITAWMDEEGAASDLLKGMEWDKLDMAAMTQELQDSLEEPIGRFFLSHTKAELYEGAINRGIMLYPVSSSADAVVSSQLEARGFWADVEHPELGESLKYPGSCVKTSEGRCGLRRRAPLIGEHNEDVYLDEMGMSREELVNLKQAGVI